MSGPEVAVALCSPAHHQGITLVQELQPLPHTAFLLETLSRLFCHGLQLPEVFSVYPMNLPSKQTGLAPLSRALAVLSFSMGDFVFLIFIMAQPDRQMLSM
jgi:hypothetical protein